MSAAWACRSSAGLNPAGNGAAVNWESEIGPPDTDGEDLVDVAPGEEMTTEAEFADAAEGASDSSGLTHAEAVTLTVDGGAESGADDAHDATSSMVAPVTAARAARSCVFTDHLV